MYKYDDKYKFDETWFDIAINAWVDLFRWYNIYHGNDTIKSVLEIGCYQGRATIFLCNNVIQTGTKYDVIDTFGGSLEEAGMIHAKNRMKDDFNYIYDTFLHNISFHTDIEFNIYKNYSNIVLPELLTLDKKYDLIYIDASHKSDDTFVDAYYAHQMLNIGGILIFDDYGWSDPNNLHIVNSPKLGIDMFLTMYADMYKFVLRGYQIGIQRIK